MGCRGGCYLGLLALRKAHGVPLSYSAIYVSKRIKVPILEEFRGAAWVFIALYAITIWARRAFGCFSGVFALLDSLFWIY